MLYKGERTNLLAYDGSEGVMFIECRVSGHDLKLNGCQAGPLSPY
jgi:hypothetical protein